MAKRYDDKHRLLKTGERQRSSGTYEYHWTSRNGKSHSISAETLEELRKKEEDVLKDKSDGILVGAENVKLDDIYGLWCHLKRGLADNTFQNYKYLYEMFVQPKIGQIRIKQLKRSDVKSLYNYLLEERGLKVNTIDGVHTVLHQVLTVAVEENYIRINIADNILKELKQSHNIEAPHRKALTVAEQELFIGYLKRENVKYHHWYPVFEVMVETGMRVGEVTGLRWEDVDFNANLISVNHPPCLLRPQGGREEQLLFQRTSDQDQSGDKDDSHAPRCKRGPADGENIPGVQPDQMPHDGGRLYGFHLHQQVWRLPASRDAQQGPPANHPGL